MAGRLFAALALVRADGRYPKMLRALSRADLLILDDWGPESLNADQCEFQSKPAMYSAAKSAVVLS